MLKQPQTKYRAFAVPPLPDRQWPGRQLTQAPRWCSTDLRDGNQALIEPMGLERKRRFFALLLAIGYREIEVAFPAASQTDFDFVRELVTADGLPDDLWLQVMTPARSELIERTFAALEGVPRAIVHLYNATAPLFRRVVFDQDRAATLAMAVAGTQRVRALCDAQPETAWTYQYSPETFCFTEADFALEICQAVREAWQPSAERPLILNLPATVEVATPNVYADQIEGFIRGLGPAPHVTISVHPHNDRGTGVACAELAQLAGATRVEGCLFGNGERTGNVDLVTLALNLYSQGITPGIDFSRLEEVASVVEACNQLTIHPRHPYGGRLALAAYPAQAAPLGIIDPADLGRVAG